MADISDLTLEGVAVQEPPEKPVFYAWRPIEPRLDLVTAMIGLSRAQGVGDTLKTEYYTERIASLQTGIGGDARVDPGIREELIRKMWEDNKSATTTKEK